MIKALKRKQTEKLSYFNAANHSTITMKIMRFVLQHCVVCNNKPATQTNRTKRQRLIILNKHYYYHCFKHNV